MNKIAVLGGGAWGSAFGGAICEDGASVCFWSRDSGAAKAAAQAAGKSADWRADLAKTTEDADMIILAVSSAGFASILRSIPETEAPVLWLAKGFAEGGALLCEAAAEILPQGACFGTVSGPSFATEVARGLPAALTVAVNRPERLSVIRDALHRKALRLYPSADLTGVCACGALKNVIAVAAGVSDGLDLGANARAAVIARGLAEMSAFSEALGGEPETAQGLAGIGDLALTCTSDMSRNRQLGLALGSGRPPSAGTVEGAAASAAASARARKLGVDAPIISAVHAVLHEGMPPARAADMLLSRPPPA